jgi:murein L,D-transpeptidase YcbB/YkuD
MRVPRSTIAWAILLMVATGAGVSVSSRFLSADPAALQLVLNIPSGRLDVFEAGALTRSYPVSVGGRGFETPAGSYKVHRVVWNPWWHPPDSKWAAGRKPTPPGPENPMGRVKLQFAELLYIHGTTEENRLGVPASHGCVRMANSDLIALTRLVHKYTTRDVGEEILAQLESNPKQTRTFYLRNRVPLAVTYDLVELRDGMLTIHPDVYRYKGKSMKEQVVAALAKQGVSASSIDETRLSEIAKLRNATRLTVPIDTLLLTGAGSGR